MNRNSVVNVRVEAGATQVVAHAGLHALGRVADRIGLVPSLSVEIPWAGERAPLHDRGTVLTHAMLMLAAGGEACADIEFLAPQQRRFGSVASDSTPCAPSWGRFNSPHRVSTTLIDISAITAVTRTFVVGDTGLEPMTSTV